jgi:hypothetical protein
MKLECEYCTKKYDTDKDNVREGDTCGNCGMGDLVDVSEPDNDENFFEEA